MSTRVRIIGILAAALLAGAAAGCGGSSTTSTSAAAATSTSTATPVPVVIKTATATVGSSSKSILTTDAGMTLYYFDPDSTLSVACSGSCAGTWPPAAASSGQVRAAGTLPGMLTVLTSANGKQVEYNGHPLYTYSGDTAPGQTHGDGIGGKWHVATPDMPVNTNTSVPSPNY